MATKSLPQDPKPAVSKAKKKRKRKLPVGVIERDGKHYVRVRYREYPGGPRHAAWRECAKNATSAKEVRKGLLDTLEKHGTKALRSARKNFGALADYYVTNYLIPAKYVDGKKVAGRRNVSNPLIQLKRLRSLVSDLTPLRSIDYGFLRRLRLAMLDMPVVVEKWVPIEVERGGKKVIRKRGEKQKFSRQRSIIDVDRHLELLRHMLKVARRELHWMQHDPFEDALEPLITRSDEKKRRRVMSFEEEKALLDNCVEDRAHLRPIIIGLVDSLMRSTEFLKLRVGDLAIAPRSITVQQMNTKTLRERAAPMSARFAAELERWIEQTKLREGDYLFAPTIGHSKKRKENEAAKDKVEKHVKSVKTAWSTLKRRAGVTNLRVKDLRRTGATRLLRRGYPMAQISQILGHTSMEMTYEYFGIDVETTSGAVVILDAMHEENEQLDSVH